MTKKPHKHAELIKLWADGAEVEVMRESNGVWGSTPTPIWDPARKYRIKPEPSYKTVKLCSFINKYGTVWQCAKGSVDYSTFVSANFTHITEMDKTVQIPE